MIPGDCRDPFSMAFLHDLLTKYNLHIRADRGTREEERSFPVSERDPIVLKRLRSEATEYGNVAASFFLDWTLRHSLDARARKLLSSSRRKNTADDDDDDHNHQFLLVSSSGSPSSTSSGGAHRGGALRKPPFPKLLRRKLSHGDPSRTFLLTEDLDGPAPGGGEFSVYEIVHLLSADEQDPDEQRRVFYFGLSDGWGNAEQPRRGAVVFRSQGEGLVAVHDYLVSYVDPVGNSFLSELLRILLK